MMNACVCFIFNLRKDDHVSYFYDELGSRLAALRRQKRLPSWLLYLYI